MNQQKWHLKFDELLHKALRLKTRSHMFWSSQEIADLTPTIISIITVDYMDTEEKRKCTHVLLVWDHNSRIIITIYIKVIS